MASNPEQRVARPIDKKAKQTADAAIVAEAGRLPDPISHEDAGLRKKWLRAYVSVGGKLEPEQPLAQQVGATIKPCPYRYILLQYLHADGTPVAGAKYVVESHQGEVWYEGTLDKNGSARIDGVPPERSSFVYYFLDDPEKDEIILKPSEPPDREAPRSVFESMLDWLWGTIQGDFNPNPDISQTATNALLGLIPVVDQALDLRDLVAGLKSLIEYYAEDERERAGHKPVIGLDYQVWLWLNLFIIAIGCIPEVGSVVKGVLKGLVGFIHRKGLRAAEALASELWWYLMKVFNYFGKSNAHEWLKRMPDHLGAWMDQAAIKIKQCLDIVKSALEGAREYASTWLARRLIGQAQSDILIATFNQVMNSLQRIYASLDAMKARINQWIREQLARVLLGKYRAQKVGVASSEIAPFKNTIKQSVEEPPKALPEVQGPRPLRLVEVLDVDSYGSQSKRSIKGDNLENDHIPSFAASKKAVEDELGRKLTTSEARSLKEHLTSITEPKEVHRGWSRTYGKKNVVKHVEDATNLRKAAQDDMEAVREALVSSGKSPHEVEKAFQAVHTRNQEIGLYGDLDKLLNTLGLRK